MLDVPERFVEEVLWPEFQELNQVLVDYLSEVTERIIREEVFAETRDAEVVAAPPRIAS